MTARNLTVSGLKPATYQRKEWGKIKKVERVEKKNKNKKRKGRERSVEVEEVVPLFRNFCLLPPEIRLQIWIHTLVPAIISPAPPQENKCLDLTNYVRRAPAVLQVCRETRYEFLFKDGEEEEWNGEGEVMVGQRRGHPTYMLCERLSALNTRNRVYVSFEIDVVVACRGTFFSPDLQCHLRHLALPDPGTAWDVLQYDYWQDETDPVTGLPVGRKGTRARYYMLKELREMRALESITFYDTRSTWYMEHDPVRRTLGKIKDEKGEGWGVPQLRDMARELIPVHPQRKWF